MGEKMKRTKRMFSILVVSAMLLNIVLPQSLLHAAANSSQQSPSRGSFDTKEVNRILDGLTPEQKANINKLT